MDDDIRRLTIAPEELGPDATPMIDTNQVWEVGEAIEWVRRLAFADLFLIEEPTSPDDILGDKAIRDAVAPIRLATGEMCQNRVLFKQIIAAGAIDIMQIDACRLGGVNTVLAVQLMAVGHGLPDWPHAGGVSLCEYVQHLSRSTRLGPMIEYVDHLHEHFTDPYVVRNGAYMAPAAPGFSARIRDQTLPPTRPDREGGRPVGHRAPFGRSVWWRRPRAPPSRPRSRSRSSAGRAHRPLPARAAASGRPWGCARAVSAAIGATTALLAHSVGSSIAALMVMTGEPLTTEQALAWRLVSGVIAPVARAGAGNRRDDWPAAMRILLLRADDGR